MAMPDHGPTDRTLRAADADRDAVAETLRQQHLAGRLDTDELQERIERCYEARTYAELDALLVDLPGHEPPADADARARRPRRSWVAAPLPLLPLLPLLIVALAVSHAHVLWLLLPLAFFFFVIRPLRWHAPAGAGCAGRYRGRPWL
jgi:uncharacterized protein DUF1707